jgi:hypothetical protein
VIPELTELARQVETATQALAEADTIARSLGLPTYVHAPLAKAAFKADFAADGLNAYLASRVAEAAHREAGE